MHCTMYVHHIVPKLGYRGGLHLFGNPKIKSFGLQKKRKKRLVDKKIQGEVKLYNYSIKGVNLQTIAGILRIFMPDLYV